ncbi:hypothetical protein [Vibrio superstes]|uniref:Uncharacterized protein n=1 Tax=Vibrio superstes NBRC 103154 TaxID=1219062 RepID=A0A511QKJ5_9VIBR|nr:hypothetical protein [Vibrio superstes]GEM77848.1 hypothetical protein VSU01S_00930 [Vibrio superstes NBRC 103154]
MKIEEFVQQITAVNRAWKVAQEDCDNYINTHIAKILQEQKSAWQVEFYRSYPTSVWFKTDVENFPSGDVFSVRFGNEAVRSTDGDSKWNAEHIPKILLKSLLTESEYLIATQPKV